MAVDMGLFRPLVARILKPARQLGTPPRCIHDKLRSELLSILQPHTCKAGLSVGLALADPYTTLYLLNVTKRCCHCMCWPTTSQQHDCP